MCARNARGCGVETSPEAVGRETQLTLTCSALAFANACIASSHFEAALFNKELIAVLRELGAA